MKKFKMICLGAVVLTLEGAEARIDGPFPTLYNPVQTLPSYPVTPQQTPHIRQAFDDMHFSFQQNHALSKDRNECLRLDLASLANFVKSNPSHPATPLFRKIFTLIRSDFPNQKFAAQWIVFQNLSPQRQKEFRNGLRISPLQPQKVQKAWGVKWITAPATFNQDDVLTTVLEKIEQQHRNCEGYAGCLSADLQIIDGVRNRLSNIDPVRTSLSMLRELVRHKADQNIFNSELYLTLYNPLNPDWYDARKKFKAKHLAGAGYAQWNQVRISSPQPRWYSARITNGTLVTTTPVGQNPAFVPAPYPVAPDNGTKNNPLKQFMSMAEKYAKDYLSKKW